jgi:hypothetical protein
MHPKDHTIMRVHLSLTVPLVLLLLAGCGDPNKARGLSGKVTYNNNPVTGGTITLLPKEGGRFVGTITADGTYLVPDVAPGTYTVTIETESINPDKPKAAGSSPPGAQGSSPGPGASMPAGGAGSAPTGKYVKIDLKYADPTTSGLSVTVKGGGGGQTENFPLTGP